MSPAHEIAIFLAAHGVGTLGGQTGWGIFVAEEPAKPDNTITLYDDGAGDGPDTDELDIQRSIVRVRVRSAKDDYEGARDKHIEIRDLLIEAAPLTTDDAYFIGLKMLNDPAAAGRDDNERHIITALYEAEEQRDTPSSLEVAAQSGRIRTLLREETSYYITVNGSDETGDGSEERPWRTTVHAAEHVATRVDIGGQLVRMRVGPGDFDGVYNGSYVGGGVVFWMGSGIDPAGTFTRLGNVLNPSGFTIGSFNVLKRSNTEVWLNNFILDPTAGPAIDCDQASAGDGIIVFGDLDNFIDGRLRISGFQNNSFAILGNFFDVGNEIVVDVSSLPATTRGFVNGLTKSAPFFASAFSFINGAFTSTVAFFVINAETLCQTFSTWVGTFVGPRFIVESGVLFMESLTSLPGDQPGKVIGGGTVSYTGSDGVFGGTNQQDDHNIDYAAGTHELTNEESGHHVTNEGAAGPVIFNLPPVQKDIEFIGIVCNANGFRFQADGTNTIRLETLVSLAGGRIDSVTNGSVISLRGKNSTEWVAKFITGTWVVT